MQADEILAPLQVFNLLNTRRKRYLYCDTQVFHFMIARGFCCVSIQRTRARNCGSLAPLTRHATINSKYLKHHSEVDYYISREGRDQGKCHLIY